MISTVTRLALLIATASGIPTEAGNYAFAFSVGLVYDLLAFVYYALPLVLLLWMLPRRWLAGRAGSFAVKALCFTLLFVAAFVAVAEWTFWEEFQTRFNFIAVDYLVYTSEVLGTWKRCSSCTASKRRVRPGSPRRRQTWTSSALG